MYPGDGERGRQRAPREHGRLVRGQRQQGVLGIRLVAVEHLHGDRVRQPFHRVAVGDVRALHEPRHQGSTAPGPPASASHSCRLGAGRRPGGRNGPIPAPIVRGRRSGAVFRRAGRWSAGAAPTPRTAPRARPRPPRLAVLPTGAQAFPDERVDDKAFGVVQGASRHPPAGRPVLREPDELQQRGQHGRRRVERLRLGEHEVGAVCQGSVDPAVALVVGGGDGEVASRAQVQVGRVEGEARAPRRLPDHRPRRGAVERCDGERVPEQVGAAPAEERGPKLRLEHEQDVRLGSASKASRSSSRKADGSSAESSSSAWSMTIGTDRVRWPRPAPAGSERRRAAGSLPSSPGSPDASARLWAGSPSGMIGGMSRPRAAVCSSGGWPPRWRAGRARRARTGRRVLLPTLCRKVADSASGKPDRHEGAAMSRPGRGFAAEPAIAAAA